ncbi:hypothetical protein BaOVIS_021620 [Babesia ovis]|uniref:Uncharacterized protein n=1 Tax=Babesia ovis TaxID=5869 RepID=A0A9W5TBG5_BABOV|nr:hypothetical protein BaOVIS_021620 [Babesia ovis]
MGTLSAAIRAKWPCSNCTKCDTTVNTGFLRIEKRDFAYYRFHKRVGQGNWNRYVERYIKPRSIENTQRIIFNYHASFQAAKNSASYLWELPKRIAAATSANEVLDAWVHFRHKRKKAYHFVLALRRLCEIKDVDTSDWRFQFLTKKLLKRSKYFIDLPNICRYLGQLRAVPTLDKLSLVLCENVDRYTFTQLATIAHAYGTCRLHCKYLFATMAKQFEEKLSYASNSDLILVAEAYGKCMVYNYGLLAQISLELQKRMSSLPLSDAQHGLTGTPTKHCIATLLQPVTVQVQRPTLNDILRLAEAFTVAKHRDMQIFEILSQMTKLYIQDGANTVDPQVPTRVVRAFCNSKINDIPLFTSILASMSTRPYNYAPSCIAEIGKHLSTVLPRSIDTVSKAYAKCLQELHLHINRMDRRQLTDAAIFAHKGYTDTGCKSDFLKQISKAIVDQDGTRVIYDAPKLLEMLSMHGTVSEQCFNTICRDVYRIVDHFEPVDFQRIARVLRSLKRHNLTNIKMVNMLSKHVISHCDEFSSYQYHCVARDLTLAGPPFMSLLTDLWRHNRATRTYHSCKVIEYAELPSLDTSCTVKLYNSDPTIVQRISAAKGVLAHEGLIQPRGVFPHRDTKDD